MLSRLHLITFWIITMALLLGASCTTVRGSANPAVGSWTGQIQDEALHITLNPDGSCYGIENGKTTNGNWSQKGASVTLTFEREDLHGGLISRNEMVLTEENPRRAIILQKRR